MDRIWIKTDASGMQDVAAAAQVSGSTVLVTGGNGTLWRTMDDGKTFSQLVGSGFRRVAVSPDGSVVWAVRDDGTVAGTTDLTTWSELNVASHIPSGVEDVVVDYDKSIWLTAKNGQMWRVAGSDFQSRTVLARFKRVAIGPGESFWGITVTGELLHKRGAGPDATWEDTGAVGMEDVSVSSDGDVWLVGSDGTIWTTRDGKDLARVTGTGFTGPGFMSISAGPGGVVWLIGLGGRLWNSHVSSTPPVLSQVWTKTVASGMQDVAALAQVSSSTVLVAGGNGTLWRTMDDGKTFGQLAGSGFRRVAVSPDGSVVWAVRDDGTVAGTTDLTTWSELNAASHIPSGVEDVVVDYDKSIWLTAKNGQMWRVAGSDFQSRTVLARFKRVAIGPGESFWGITATGELLHKRGAAPDATWEDTDAVGMEDVSVSSDGDVWLVGSDGTVWVTRDGKSANAVKTSGSGFRSISAAPSQVAWAVGLNGSLWKLSPPPPVAKFTPTPGSGFAPLVVKFVNQSSGAVTSSEWIIAGAPQGATAGLTSPTRTFATPGPVPVRLIVNGPGGSSTADATVTVNRVVTPDQQGFDELLIQNCHTSHRELHIYFRLLGDDEFGWIPINDSPHSADYNSAGTCPASPDVGARFAMDDGKIYEVVCTDPELPGCQTGGPGEMACRRSAVFVVRGKLGGGVKVVIVN